MNTIDVCLSPDLIHLYEVKDSVVVVVDILRATSCMTTGLAHGIKSIRPFAQLEECKMMKTRGYCIAGERNGQKFEDFDLGNSPFDYMDKDLQGKSIAVTTTNGTVAIEKCKDAAQVIIGSFLNISAVAQHLREQDMNVLILCAGWKGKVNMEDSLFAGALVERLQKDFVSACDAPLLLQATYQAVNPDLLTVVQQSSHAKRLNKLHIHEDIAFCLKIDEYDVVPVLNNDEIVALKEPSVSK